MKIRGGRWDLSLAFVMGAAVAASSIAVGFAKRRNKSLLGSHMHIPALTAVTFRLVAGSAVSALAGGLAGLCPGPALVALGVGLPKAWAFVAAMLAGMMAFEFIERAKQSRHQA